MRSFRVSTHLFCRHSARNGMGEQTGSGGNLVAQAARAAFRNFRNVCISVTLTLRLTTNGESQESARLLRPVQSASVVQEVGSVLRNVSRAFLAEEQVSPAHAGVA